MQPSAKDTLPVREYSRVEILRRFEDPQLVIANALPRAAYEEARIPGSISLPLADIDAHAREILPDLERETAVYCGGPT